MWDRIKLIITEQPLLVLFFVGYCIYAIFFVTFSKQGKTAKVLAAAAAIIFLVLLIALVVNEQWMINIALGVAGLAFVLLMAIGPRRGD